MSKIMEKTKDFTLHDHIQNLSNDLLLLVFTKLIGFDQNSTLADIKFLCRCSLVSKRFNSIIPLLPSLSLVFKSRYDLFTTTSFPQIINKFQHIRSLYIECGCRFKPKYNLNWKATCRSSTTYCIAGISYDSTEKYSSAQHKNLPYQLLNHPDEDIRYRSATCIIMCAIHCIHYRILEWIKNYETLQHIVIREIENPGSLILNKEQLFELRNSCSSTFYGGQRQYYQHYYFIENLHLPVLGLLLKGVTFIVMKDGENAADLLNNDYDQILGAMSFRDDETILHEALISIFGKLRDKSSM